MMMRCENAWRCGTYCIDQESHNKRESCSRPSIARACPYKGSECVPDSQAWRAVGELPEIAGWYETELGEACWDSLVWIQNGRIITPTRWRPIQPTKTDQEVNAEAAKMDREIKATDEYDENAAKLREVAEWINQKGAWRGSLVDRNLLENVAKEIVDSKPKPETPAQAVARLWRERAGNGPETPAQWIARFETALRARDVPVDGGA